LFKSSKFWYFYTWLLTAAVYGQTGDDSLPEESKSGLSGENAAQESIDVPSAAAESNPAASSPTQETGDGVISLPEAAAPSSEKADNESAESLSERRRWSANSSLGYSRSIDSVNLSQYLSYSTGFSRRADDNSSWGASVSFGQNCKYGDDPTVDGISWSHGFASDKDRPRDITYSYSGGLLDPQNIGNQGLRLQNAMAVRQNIYAEGDLTVAARISTFFLLTEYEQTISGQEYTRFGLGESLVASYAYGKFSLGLSFGFDHGYRGSTFHFTNSNSESLDYSFDRTWGIGMSHSVSSLVLDPVVRGTQPTILLGDAENSQFSFYVSYAH
jgi:hypothetical protein